jgi:predicted nucleic acid-binding Zn ribbon protein
MIPNHCADCGKPVSNLDSWLCDECREGEEE